MIAPRFVRSSPLLLAFLLTITGSVSVIVSVIAVSAALAQPPAATEAGDKSGDPRVKAALDTLKYKYTVSAGKVYQLTFDLKEKRSQVVMIDSATQKFSKLEIREVTSTAYKVKGKLPAEQALRLLADNDKRQWGGWRIIEDGGFTYVLYAVQLPADSTAETLDSAIDATMYTADERENEITKADEF